MILLNVHLVYLIIPEHLDAYLYEILIKVLSSYLVLYPTVVVYSGNVSNQCSYRRKFNVEQEIICKYLENARNRPLIRCTVTYHRMALAFMPLYKKRERSQRN